MSILIDSKHKALIDSKSGKSMHPTCFDDLIAYHAYLMGRHPKQANQMLKDVFNGEKVMSNMVLKMRGEK